jgi:hypothetical protein
VNKDENDPYLKTYVKLGLSDGVYIQVLKGITKKDKYAERLLQNWIINRKRNKYEK